MVIVFLSSKNTLSVEKHTYMLSAKKVPMGETTADALSLYNLVSRPMCCETPSIILGNLHHAQKP